MSKENYEWLNLIPVGWTQIAKQMIKECEAIDPTYTIENMKEKWGHLDVYSYVQLTDYFNTKKENQIYEIEQKYWKLSAQTCSNCGAPATKMSTGWVLPFCDECGIKPEKYYKRFK